MGTPSNKHAGLPKVHFLQILEHYDEARAYNAFLLRASLTYDSHGKDHLLLDTTYLVPTLGIQIRNMKMVFNINGTWHRVTFEKLMMKIDDFFYSAKSFSHPV